VDDNGVRAKTATGVMAEEILLLPPAMAASGRRDVTSGAWRYFGAGTAYQTLFRHLM